MVAQVKVYRLPDHVQDAVEYPQRYVEDVLDGFVVFDRDRLEDCIESKLGDVYIVYKEVKRKKTTSYAFNLKDPESDEVVRVKIVIQFRESDGFVKGVRYEGLDFVRGLEYLVGDF